MDFSWGSAHSKRLKTTALRSHIGRMLDSGNGTQYTIFCSNPDPYSPIGSYSSTPPRPRPPSPAHAGQEQEQLDGVWGITVADCKVKAVGLQLSQKALCNQGWKYPL